MYNYLTFILQL